ncbi:hypothetical protein ASD04_11905 [Devosia sp. Root436]|uniref:SRPBCC family protein n=1 Tax=Devosia sp. Root436 TaxID=1736537 RepID=UPI0006FD471D|nr:SRPBCC domain-containing protein [Devosia sp. Root436]KQX38305.1 hypothetical protein ASD04_11905 [Devosia sp. Root436]
MAPTYRQERGFRLTRMLDAPPEVVWRAWTEPRYLDWFFNPGTRPDHATTVDLRVGGTWRQHMVETAERHYMTGGIYREIVPNRRLVFSWGASGGWPDTDDGNGPQVTVELTPVGERTRMDVALHLPDQLSQAEVEAWLDKGIEPGMAMTIDRLVEKLAAG